MQTLSSGIHLRSKARRRQVSFLIEEYKLITDSLMRNEESGEKRAAFFMTLAGAAGGAVAFVFSRESPVGQPPPTLWRRCRPV